MNKLKVEPTRLMTACIGLSGEVGEFNDTKKCFFQGKEMDEDTVTHLKKNLDVMWYVAQDVLH